jgi:hypothetical protein
VAFPGHFPLFSRLPPGRFFGDATAPNDQDKPLPLRKKIPENAVFGQDTWDSCHEFPDGRDYNGGREMGLRPGEKFRGGIFIRMKKKSSPLRGFLSKLSPGKSGKNLINLPSFQITSWFFSLF